MAVTRGKPGTPVMRKVQRYYEPPPGTHLCEISQGGVVYRHYYPVSQSPSAAALLLAKYVSNGDPIEVEWTTHDTKRVVRATIVFTDKVDFVRVILPGGELCHQCGGSSGPGGRPYVGCERCGGSGIEPVP